MKRGVPLFKKHDLIIYSSVLLLFIVYAVVCAFRVNGADVRIQVLSDGKIMFDELLNDVPEGEYPFSNDYGSIKLKIEGGGASVEESTCPDFICINSGVIKNNGECIVCVPNRFVVRLIGGTGEVDTIVG